MLSRLRLFLALLAVAAVGVLAYAAVEPDSYPRRMYRRLRHELSSYPRFPPRRYNYFRLAGARPHQPTVLAFGADDRLYVAELDGTIRAYTIHRGPFGYAARSAETIGVVYDLPNRDDTGREQPDVRGRLVTGLAPAGSRDRPGFYVTSSDPRIEHPRVDTNSGIVSYIERTPSGWRRTDLVRGLPRSRVDHAPHGIVFDEARRRLFVAQGGNTNMGAPSEFFYELPEYALAGTILEIDLDALPEGGYDLPTLDDEDRPGVADAGDPFGGNGGKNQAVQTRDGPVRIHATGFRNPFDLALTGNGLYVTDNGANQDFGGKPAADAAAKRVGNDLTEGGRAVVNSLHHVGAPGYYAGHPNPTRADPRNLFNDTLPQSPVLAADFRQSRFVPPRANDGVLSVFAQSTNGIAHWKDASREAGGDVLLTVGRDRNLRRIVTSADGTRAVSRRPIVANLGAFPLDVVVREEADAFPSTSWVSDYAGDAVLVIERQGDGERRPVERLRDAVESVRTKLSRLAAY